MILYVDESINDDYFVVGGFMCKSDYEARKMFKQFRLVVKSFPMTTNDKRRILNEMKSIYIDTSYPELKKDMLKMMCKKESKIVYAYLKIEDRKIKQDEKEKIYVKLLGEIVSDINENIVILYDQFKKKDFETKIVDTISPRSNVILIEGKNSISSKGVQLADNVCSSIRRYLSNTDTNNYYEILRNNVAISIEMEIRDTI